MSTNIYSYLLFKSLYQPLEAFKQLSQSEPSPLGVMLRYSIWLLILPPAFSLIGAANFGWRLGAAEPLRLPLDALLLVSSGYFVVLVFGLFSTALISSWMAATYGASTALGRHVALITIFG
tara:strand:+ start:76 stop:438 length:363 start_codon:yes stop_codon:yes gene_type:complete